MDEAGSGLLWRVLYPGTVKVKDEKLLKKHASLRYGEGCQAKPTLSLSCCWRMSPDQMDPPTGRSDQGSIEERFTHELEFISWQIPQKCAGSVTA